MSQGDELGLGMRMNYGRVLCQDDGATLDEVREAVSTLEEIQRIARRVLGGSHPLALRTEIYLRNSLAALRARETPSPGAA